MTQICRFLSQKFKQKHYKYATKFHLSKTSSDKGVAQSTILTVSTFWQGMTPLP